MELKVGGPEAPCHRGCRERNPLHGVERMLNLLQACKYGELLSVFGMTRIHYMELKAVTTPTALPFSTSGIHYMELKVLKAPVDTTLDIPQESITWS